MSSQVRTAIVRSEASGTDSAVHGILHAGDIVMGFEQEECRIVPDSQANTFKTLRRIRVTRIHVGMVSAAAQLTGWTSMESYAGDVVLQLFD